MAGMMKPRKGKGFSQADMSIFTRPKKSQEKSLPEDILNRRRSSQSARNTT